MPQILVVDDQPTNRDVLATLLRYQGHSVSEAADGVEGLAVATHDQPDLIISDVLMPTMDGFEFVRRLRLEPLLASTPVVFCTAHYLEKEALALAEKCGVSYVLRKPCHPTDVLRVVDGALGVVPERTAPADDIAQEHLQLLTTRLSKTAEDLARVNTRLQALIEAGQKMATEHDPVRLVDQYCRATRDIVGAGLCVIGVLEESGNWRHVATSGLSGEAAEEISVRLKPDALDSGLDFSPAQHIGIVIRTPKNFLGWLCVANKLGNEHFSEEDEQLARTMAAQLAAAYENVLLYEQSRRHAEELEERVRRRTRELEAAKEELESFTFAVSHDLRVPLHHLSGFASLLEQRFGQSLETEAGDLVRRIHRASRQMTDLVKAVLDLSRISKQDVVFEPVRLDGVVAEALEEVRGTVTDRPIDWSIHPLPEVQGSAPLLKQVFVNLLSNAVKFTGRTETPRIEVGQTLMNGEAAIYVRDNGAGFDPRKAEKLFGLFQRLHSQSEFPGNGAGLSIVQRIVNRHSGKIWAESAPDQGATFYFTLPAAEASQ